MYTTLIDADTLRRELSDGSAVCVFDVSFDLARPEAGRQQFEAAQVPGSSYLHLDADLSAPKTGRNGRHPMPTREEIARRAAGWGVTPRAQVVALDRSGGVYAARLWWMLRWIGHEAVAVLDGGMAAWQAVGGELASETQAAPPVAESTRSQAKASGPLHKGQSPAQAPEALPLRPPADAQAMDAETLLAHLGRPDTCVIDARAPERFRGETEPLDPVAGHIPGALNHPYTDNLGPDGRFHDAPRLQALWSARLGGREPRHTVHQCGSGVTACHNLLAMAAAGMKGARLYPGSWSEWCADPARPVARG